MSLFPRSLRTFASEFELWPLPADEEALALSARRPPGYFDCDDIALRTPQEEVENGMVAALAHWADWEASHVSLASLEGQRVVRLPPGMRLREHDKEVDRDESRDSRTQSVQENMNERSPSSRNQGENGTPSAHHCGERVNGSIGSNLHVSVEGPDELAMLDILDKVPDFKRVEAGLRSRMESSQLALGRWRLANEKFGAGMRDFRRLPFLRKAVNVVQAPVLSSMTCNAAPEAGQVMQDDEALVTVTIFGNRASMLYRQEDYLLRAGNTLGDLHRVLSCSLAAMMAQGGQGDRSWDSLQAGIPAFFFIEGKFYAAMQPRGHKQGEREEQTAVEHEEESHGRTVIEHLRSIMAWTDEPGKNRREQLGLGTEVDWEVLDMDRVRLSDLTLRIGTRYLYSHLGECEHHFNISDIRLLGPQDSRNCQDYPALVFQKHYRRRRCAVCDVRLGKFCALGDPVGDDHRMIYCEFCHYLLHYDAEGHLLRDDFELFPYMHDD
ncbi:hypothetical protein NSK_004575 [Nannochloropsis salina CCMP1776]|uniref:snRNA-activating protein complex subunit 3 n=1 Tax=Nannochloropsis salina CCMP1776 TaxID=1027361 RepID=A0A4D9CXQ5_9STRA|nr:hypothetical protein NSK_004575 [Nannochloropsis salina CCMP1776]|eukprot:TFJ84102.1 hypothetical protein NSK_004575 [Nannochloropsis salina CCMP1776]